MLCLYPANLRWRTIVPSSLSLTMTSLKSIIAVRLGKSNTSSRSGCLLGSQHENLVGSRSEYLIPRNLVSTCYFCYSLKLHPCPSVNESLMLWRCFPLMLTVDKRPRLEVVEGSSVKVDEDDTVNVALRAQSYGAATE